MLGGLDELGHTVTTVERYDTEKDVRAARRRDRAGRLRVGSMSSPEKWYGMPARRSGSAPLRSSYVETP